MEAKMYCVWCKEVVKCQDLPPEALGHSDVPQQHHRHYPTIQWYRRGRLCSHCNRAFTTAEVCEKHLLDLIRFASLLAIDREKFKKISS
jgi:transcriptional regulator NrdR family protein